MRRSLWCQFAKILTLEVIAIVLLAIPVTVNNGGDIPLPSYETAQPLVIASGSTIKQEFPVPRGTVSSIAILFATYQRANTGNLRITISAQAASEQWQTLLTRQVPKGTLKDNALYPIVFDPPLVLHQDQRLALTFEDDGSADQAVALWSNSTLQRSGYQLFVNNETRAGVAHFTLRYQPNSGYLWNLFPTLVSRITLFVNPQWQIVLALGGIIALWAIGWILIRFLRLPPATEQ